MFKKFLLRLLLAALLGALTAVLVVGLLRWKNNHYQNACYTPQGQVSNFINRV